MMQYIVELFSVLVSSLPGVAWAGIKNLPYDSMSMTIFWVVALFGCAIFGRLLAKFIKQPNVLGELLIGILIGNLCYFFGIKLFFILREGSSIFAIINAMSDGNTLAEMIHRTVPVARYADQLIELMRDPIGIDLVKVAYVIDVFAYYGIIFLLFMVGLESSWQELQQVGVDAVRVALIGVFAPVILGYFTTHFILPNATMKTCLFVAATLAATSIGITARTLKEMQLMATREAKTIVCAAVFDDILGLLILTIVSHIALTGYVDFKLLAYVIIAAVVFFVVMFTLGPLVLRGLIRLYGWCTPWETKLFAAFTFLMLVAWFATLLHMNAIIGAFVAGLITHDGLFPVHKDNAMNQESVRQILLPFEAIFAPLFFTLVGIQVKLETLLNWRVLMAGFLLTMVAILGKLVSGLGASKAMDRWIIGLGMVPRGEIGIIFATLGRNFGVISDGLFSALILMVMLTTFIAPSLMLARLEGFIMMMDNRNKQKVMVK